MRVVSYNILDGGEGRADPLAEVLLAQRADVVVLVEADDPGVAERIAQRLNMDCVHAPGNRKAAALLSRWPIVESINWAPLRTQITKSLLQATVVDPTAAGQRWTFGVVHLHHHALEADESLREKELAIVLEMTARLRQAKQQHLLLGDFNSNSPLQQIDPEQCRPRTRQAWQQNGGEIPRRVVRRLMDEGYLDTLAVADEPASRTVGTFTTQDPGQRIDYIFAWGVPARRIRSAWVEQDRLARYASDHFPVGVEIE